MLSDLAIAAKTASAVWRGQATTERAIVLNTENRGLGALLAIRVEPTAALRPHAAADQTCEPKRFDRAVLPGPMGLAAETDGKVKRALPESSLTAKVLVGWVLIRPV